MRRDNGGEIWYNITIMKWYIGLAAFAFAVLACASVWFGGLNQDEGWYLYAANLVSEGYRPYSDFFFTQGPVMPIVYSAFSWVWRTWGLLGARVFTLLLGAVGILFASAAAGRLAERKKRGLAAIVVALLLGGNLYHLYYMAIPKTYALAGLFVAIGFYLLTFCGRACLFGAGLCLAFAAGTRFSLGVLCVVALIWLLARGERLGWLWFGLGGAIGGALVFGPILLDPAGRTGFFAALRYHAAREGFDAMVAAGSLSRLVRWYAPVFVMLGLGLGCGRFRRGVGLAMAGFGAVFAVQMMAPVPYEDYQVPIMGLLAMSAGVMASEVEFAKCRLSPALLALGLAWAGSFGSPLLEGWTTNGHDRFWTNKKAKSEIRQLMEVAQDIESLDPGGKEILTQDLYLAIETNRRVPIQLAMGPFAYWGDTLPYAGAEKVLLDDAGMEALLESAPCEIAAMSGYTFAITAPGGSETPMERQIWFWSLLKRRYNMVFTEEDFGQHATPLLVLKRKNGQDIR